MKTRTRFRLYLITDRKLFSDGEAFYDAIGEACAAGADCIQLREKDLPARSLLAMACRLREVTLERGARLIINDRVDIALVSGADGVHLGGKSIPVAAARKASGGRLLIGVSVHGAEEAEKAEADGADFITLGPVYETPSKIKYGAPLGIDVLVEAVKRLSVPVYAIGGITAARAEEVMHTGAEGVAVISAILGHGDVRANTESFMRVLE